MLTHLSIHNYALISQLSIDFTTGLSIITGETGAGKSILLGALGLVMGNRADLSSLKNTEKKCVIEAEFALKGYDLNNIFEELDIDYEDDTIIRREILPSGKSRAFVNDTPVRLSVLSALKAQLIDIHSQHQTLELSDEGFQYSILDALAKNSAKMASYKRGLRKYNSIKKALKELQEEAQKSTEQYEYNLHLFNELEEANLQIGEQEKLEEKLDKLNNIEDIKLNLSESLHIVSNDDIGLQSQLNLLENKLQKISSYSSDYETLFSRIMSVKIELDDVVSELESENEKVDFNPSEIEELNDRLQLIYGLQKKHTVGSINELLKIHEDLGKKVAQVEGASDLIQNKEKEIEEVGIKLDDLANVIMNKRNKAIGPLQKQLKYLLTELGMPNAEFLIEVKPSESFNSYGKDQLSFLFSANKGGNFGELKKVASGGELSRIMLSIKNILSKNIKLPTIIFDEIDTGVSGEVSNKIAAIMNDMANHMQVITITHLPQIASQGQQHYKVYKGENNGVTTSNLKLLNYDDRVAEIAEMLSGKDYSESALTHAKELLAK
ncbi:DNA replication and repair protein RecN [Tenacibaculum sp. MAR_2009_124]|uniref:DNA repair protein RecN n=1 Tax=Tenacibaculum sp. MAR_2009_124 TaxID=1250059 RepID=UPI00089B1BD0|nr:DNA repair protein RecN [Tenacibaculum sp. MAR_2009_124]SEB53490.1 DNA replication and repair protein RecN [Tenacibaculum sp. MAR_2009_124]